MSVRPRGLSDDGTTRVLIARTAPPEAYHEWVFVGVTLQADRNGVTHRGQGPTTWAKVVCNNPECSGSGWVDPALLLRTLYEQGLRP